MNYPFHINPETNRANKCYKIDKCRFGIDSDDHYATAAEALAVRDARIAEKQLADASQQYYHAHDARLNEQMIQNQEHRHELADELKTLVDALEIEVNDSMRPRQVVKLLESSENAENHENTIARVKTMLRDVSRESRKVRKTDSVYTGWTRFFEADDGTIHSSIDHMSTNQGWQGESDRKWLVDLSGKTPEEAIKTTGPNLCSNCFTNVSEDFKQKSSKKAARKDKVHCSASATDDFNRDTADLGKASGNTAVCNVCHQLITVNLNGNLRMHRKEDVKTGAVQNTEAKIEVPA